MKIYNQTKTEILENPDLTKGYLQDDFLEIVHEEQPAIPRLVEYKTIAEYPNGGKDVEEVVVQEGREYRAAYIEQKPIQVYIPYPPEPVLTAEQIAEQELQNLRNQRERECFPVINRGQLWYNTLTEEQWLDLEEWYDNWLNVTKTKSVPVKPYWLK